VTFIRHLGQRYPFHDRPWTEIRDLLAPVVARNEAFGYLIDIIDSVLAAGADKMLAATTSMHDILVVPRPIPQPPYEMIAVRAPNSLHPPTLGTVRIEHQSLTGRNDCIERPATEAVRLFWRFIQEKYGIVVQRPQTG
jgi:hypothetical protein